MYYTPIKCPNCGSNSVVPAENNRIYCKSCDSLHEKNTSKPQSVRRVPAQVLQTRKARLDSEEFKLACFTVFLLLLIAALTAGSYISTH